MLKGVDVSQHNGIIDWKKVKAAGYDFAMIRAGYGGTKDIRFDYNAKNAIAAGVRIGAYWFSYALNAVQAREEANLLLSIVKPYKIDFPLAYDFEYDSVRYANKQGVKITKELASRMADTFLSTVRNAGYVPANYTNVDYLRNYFTSEVTNKYDLWLAAWRNNKNKPTGYSNLTIWQHDVLGSATDVQKGWARATGSVNGINGAIDVDYCYKNYGTENKVQSTVTYFKKCNYTGVSITEALRSIGENTGFTYRKQIAQKNNIKNYSGTATQNIIMLNLLKQGKLLKP